MKYYITKERFEELKTELERLKKEERSEIAERLKRAKEYGDLSENSEYTAAKDEQARLEGQIIELENVLRNSEIIKKTSGKGVIQIGSTIEIKRKDKIFKYTIVGSQEANPESNFISNESPLGRAFLDKKAGDIVKIETPGGTVEYKIMKIG
ncbi:MAG: transcription elongation factor GreA [Patescibacteria group bacterium]